MNPLCDGAGAEIRVGDTVRQANAAGTPWFHPDKGALLVNAGERGTVVGLGRTRVRVDFGRTKRDVFGTVESTEAVIDVVNATMLTVVERAAGADADLFAYRKLTQDELVAQLRARYGDDPMQWAFICPTCKTVTTGQMMSDALKAYPSHRRTGEKIITSDVLGRECIGRTDPDQGCDWAAYGLFKGPWEVEIEKDKTMYCFPIAPAPPP
jgi:hypothetical protein